MLFFKKKSPNIFEKLGFKLDQEGIMNRYTREALTWDIHLSNTKKFILKASEKVEKNTVVVLGSGWLLDVPLVELSAMFKKVYLVDIVQPPQIKYRVKKYPNVHLIETDITGNGAEIVWNAVDNYKNKKSKTDLCQQLSQKITFGLPSNSKPDFVVSVNLWNQLSILLVEFLEKFGIYTEEELLKFSEKIQEIHLQNLPLRKSCLISDFEELNYNKANELVASKQLVFPSFPPSALTEAWEWIFDTHGIYRPKLKTVFNVRGVVL